MDKKIKQKPTRFLLVQVIPKNSTTQQAKIKLRETEHLVNTFGGKVVTKITQKRDHPDPGYYIGKGKIKEVQAIVDEKEIDVVVINDLVKTSQLFRIEKLLWDVSLEIMIWDRIDLILNIFDKHATTTEAKLQIKLAKVTHMGPRIYGLGKTELSRQGGGIGTRGKGETNIEFERRQIKIDQQKIKKELKKVTKQKQSRLRKRSELGIGPVALVGYTSAGKTTLFNALTGKNKEKNPGLFTTLDTVVGKLKSPHLDQPVLISDTIGFIDDLPPVLIESFKSTLLESLEAKLLLHVVDASDPRIMEKIAIVEKILSQLNATQPKILVLNKIDLLTTTQFKEIEKNISRYFNQEDIDHTLKNSIAISAEHGKNLDILKNEIDSFFL